MASSLAARPAPNPVTMTPAAITQIAQMMAANAALGVRLGIKKGGCAGMEYTMQMAKEKSPGDMVIEQGDACLLIEPMAQMFLFGTEIDYKSTLLESAFTFKNPNVVESCGCGESVKF